MDDGQGRDSSVGPAEEQRRTASRVEHANLVVVVDDADGDALSAQEL